MVLCDLKAFDNDPYFIVALGRLVGPTDKELLLSTNFAHHMLILSMDYAQSMVHKMKTLLEAYKVLLHRLFYYTQACQPNIATI